MLPRHESTEEEVFLQMAVRTPDCPRQQRPTPSSCQAIAGNPLPEQCPSCHCPWWRWL
jgi:hypothetical protein